MNARKEVTWASKAFGILLIVATVTSPATILAVLYVFGQAASAIS